MTELLERAFAEAAKLSSTEQDTFAQWILAELRSEHRWDQAFSSTTDELSRLAEEALIEHQAGRTHILDVDQL